MKIHKYMKISYCFAIINNLLKNIIDQDEIAILQSDDATIAKRNAQKVLLMIKAKLQCKKKKLTLSNMHIK